MTTKMPLEQSGGVFLAALSSDILVLLPEREKRMPHHFVKGDRVRLVEAHPDRATGQFGTVIRTYPMPGLYAVQFDGEAEPRVVAGSLLADVPGHTYRVQGTMTFRRE